MRFTACCFVKKEKPSEKCAVPFKNCFLPILKRASEGVTLMWPSATLKTYRFPIMVEKNTEIGTTYLLTTKQTLQTLYLTYLPICIVL